MVLRGGPPTPGLQLGPYAGGSGGVGGPPSIAPIRPARFPLSRATEGHHLSATLPQFVGGPGWLLGGDRHITAASSSAAVRFFRLGFERVISASARSSPFSYRWR